MTIVALPHGRLEICESRDPASLRAWLAGRWLILFSHPDDFAQEQLEMDRWISVLGRGFRGCGVVPVALARAGKDPEQGWLGRLAALDSGSAAVLAVDAPSVAAADFSAGALRAQISRSGPRFAMIADSQLRCRRILSYRLPSELPSPLDLAGWTVALRKRDRDREYEVPEPLPEIRSVWWRHARHPMPQVGRR